MWQPWDGYKPRRMLVQLMPLLSVLLTGMLTVLTAAILRQMLAAPSDDDYCCCCGGGWGRKRGRKGCQEGVFPLGGVFPLRGVFHLLTEVRRAKRRSLTDSSATILRGVWICNCRSKYQVLLNNCHDVDKEKP